MRGDRAGGVALALGTVGALAWANWPGSSYRHAWGTVAPWSSSLGLRLTLRDWVDQGLLLVFFLLVGLEIRREATAGELASWRRAALPVMAALSGMLVPAGIYAAVTAGSPAARGWGIPMATDVAFALGALALVGARSMPRLRVFLMTLAVADDIFSVVVLVCFYSAGVRAAWLVAALLVLAVTVVLRLRVDRAGPLVVALGAAAWLALLHAGVEAAVVGVAVGLLAPPVHRPHRAPARRARFAHVVAGTGARRWELRLGPWVNVVILPVFALANAGVALSGSGLGTAQGLRVFAAVVVARVAGKPLGIAAARWATARLQTDGASSPVRGRALVGLGATASVGFTIPLLVVRAAFQDGPLASGAIAGLLAASVLGWALALAVLRDGAAGGTVSEPPVPGRGRPGATAGTPGRRRGGRPASPAGTADGSRRPR